MQFVIVEFTDHSRLLFLKLAYYMNINYDILCFNPFLDVKARYGKGLHMFQGYLISMFS